MAGELKTSIEMMAKAMTTLGARARVQEPFTPDLQGAIEPVVKALQTVTDTFVRTANAQFEIASESARASADEALAAIGAPDLLQAATAVAQIPSGGNAFRATTVEFESGAKGIPWLEIAKEIIALVIRFIPGLAFLSDVIKEILELLDKIFGGKRHLD